jgi:hypothetical protein
VKPQWIDAGRLGEHSRLSVDPERSILEKKAFAAVNK